MAVNSFNAQNPPVTTKGDVFTFSTIPTRLGVGANDTVLTADSTAATGLKWATPTSGAFTLLSTTSLSGTSTVVSSISQSYKHLFLLFEDINMGTANDSIRIRPNSSTTNLRNASYSTASSTQVSANGNWELTQARAITTTQAEGAASVWIYNYADTDSYKTVHWTGTFYDNVTIGLATFFGHGAFNDVTAISSIQVLSGSTGTFAGGTLKIYGVN